HPSTMPPLFDHQLGPKRQRFHRQPGNRHTDHPGHIVQCIREIALPYFALATMMGPPLTIFGRSSCLGRLVGSVPSGSLFHTRHCCNSKRDIMEDDCTNVVDFRKLSLLLYTPATR